MIGNYTMILWMNDYAESLQNQIERIFLSLCEMKKVSYLVPRYITASSKEKICEVDLTKKGVEELINRNMNQRNNELGSTFSLFTSMDNNISCGILITTGTKKEQFINTIIVNIRHSLYDDGQEIDELNDLFVQLIKINNPFYACVTDNKNQSVYGNCMNFNKSIPNSVFWINYWGERISKKLNIDEKIKNTDIKTKCKIFNLHEGYYIRLQKKPIDSNNEKDFLNQTKINKILGLI